MPEPGVLADDIQYPDGAAHRRSLAMGSHLRSVLAPLVHPESDVEVTGGLRLGGRDDQSAGRAPPVRQSREGSQLSLLGPS